MAKIKARIAEDQRTTHAYEIKKGDQYWAGKEPYEGLSTGSWKTWLIKSANEFRLPPPSSASSPFWQEQFQQVEEACKNATSQQKEKILFWAGIAPNKKDLTGDWQKIADHYMWDQQISLAKLLFVRSVLAMGIEDAFIVAFDSKYTYWVKRPDMIDNQIKTYLPTPNHPSFPSAHSVVSNTSATILTYFFPAEQKKWESLAQEAGLSRIWCGIHFPIDNQEGTLQGKKVGKAILDRIQKEEIN